MTTFQPTHEQQVALDKFKARFDKKYCKKRGFANWRDALWWAWSTGQDYYCEDGSELRGLRNTPGGMEWVNELPLK